MENRKELNLSVINLVLLLLLVSLTLGCSKSVDSDLNLKCEGKNVHTYMFKGELKRTEEPWTDNLSFKDKRRYSVDTSKHTSDKCQVWTDENIQCIVEKNEEEKVDNQTFKTNFLSSYVLNRVTGEIKITLRLNDDEDIFTGTCSKIEGKKF